MRRTSAGAAALIVGVGVLAFFWLLLRPLALVFLGTVFAAALAPVIGQLEKRFPRPISVIVVYLFGLVVLILFAALAVPGIVRQTEQLSQNLPSYIDRIQIWLQERGFLDDPANLQSTITDFGASVLPSLALVPGTVFGGFLDALFVVVVSAYALIVSPSLERLAFSLFPGKHHPQLRSFLHDLTTGMGGYIRGTVINAVIVSTASYIGLSVIGVSFALVLAILLGLAQFFPIIGPVLVGILVVGVAVLNSVTTGIITLIYILIQTQITENILVPQIMSRETSLSPLLVVIGVFAGGAVGGIIGVLVAVPLLAAVQVITEYLVLPYIRYLTGAESSPPA
ncbi:MAG: AI-2E family transporter [Anaerolineae bacterium]